MDQVTQILNPGSDVVQVHIGGGTPTFLKPGQLQRLGEGIKSRFRLSEETEFSVEIDPRRCSQNHIEALARMGCNRASLGVQDTNEEVQKAIHRMQPFGQTQQVTNRLRRAGIASINLDLIYGLPKQTAQTFQQTMDDVLSLYPDRLAVYSYAHVPAVMPSQKLLKIEDMPSAEVKLRMLMSSIDYLTKNGYRYIGMDHFSREDEELSVALQNGTLQRNFQGYSTQAGADLYAFGMSGISNAGSWYWQNTKDIGTYYEQIDSGEAPVFKILSLSRDDLIRKDVIMSIMCRMGVEFDAVSSQWEIDFPAYFRKELMQLKALEQDGLVTVSTSRMQITETGRLFLRNIAMCFDHYLKASKALYSRAI
jgi:oxygen-independent coproporphyrinogen-3 oxidase